MKHANRASILLLGLLAAGSVIYAQGLGSILGRVSDPTGAIIPSASVTATQTDTGTTTTVKTNETGMYVFPSLRPSGYSIVISASGFKNFVEKNIVLQANQSETIDAVLEVGTTSQTISVDADAVQVDTSTSTLSQVIDRASVNDLPLNGRNAAQLTTLVAGVITSPNEGTDQGVTKTFPAAIEISANGSFAGQTVYLLDGADNLDDYTNANLPMPFPDALQEFSFQTSNYNAEYGQSAGGVVNVVTKSGASSFHGDLFEYVRNGIFNARNHFATAVDPLKRNQLGGTLGGPVVIPHLVSGKKTFFFVGYQKTMTRDQVGGETAYVPTQANLQGDFSNVLTVNPSNPLGKAIKINDPVTGAPFPGNQIPVSRFDKAALAVTQDLPSATGNGQIVYQTPTDENFWEILARGDQEFGSHDRGFAHYYADTFVHAGVFNKANLVTYADQSNIHFQSAVVSETHTFSDALLNDIVVGYEREISIRGPLPGVPDAKSFGVNMWTPSQPAIQSISTSGFFSIGDEAQGLFQRNNYTLSDNVHWVKGRHNLLFGTSLELAKMDVNSLTNEPGKFAFNSTTTNYALASFMLGYMNSFIQGSGQLTNERDQFYAFYGQDSWQLSNRLTLNYGLRYDPFLPWQETGLRTMQFSPAAYAAGRVSTVYTNAPPGLLFPGDRGVPAQGVRNSYKEIAPRVGFALDVFGTGKTSLRGGGGIFYQTRQTSILNQKVSQLTPFSISVTQTPPQGPFSNPYLGITNPFPAPSPSPANVAFPGPVQAYSFDDSGTFKVPATYEWNLTIEQQLTKSLISRIAYVGAHSSHIVIFPELNPATYIPGSKLSTTQRERYQGYTHIVQNATAGNDSYNALQLTLEQRVAHGLSVMANYTWAHSMSDIPVETIYAGQNTSQSYVYPIYQVGYKALDIGPPDFDRKSVFSGSYIWMLPKLGHGNFVTRMLVNGWQTTGIFQIRSGDPLTIAAGADISQTNILKDRAVYNGSSPYGTGACATNSACKNYLNISAFSLPATGQFGNVVKGSFRGPGYFNWDGGLIRNFNIREAAHVEFRAEYFNLLNRTNYSDPVTSVSGAGFGGITGASDPRIAQLSMKLVF